MEVEKEQHDPNKESRLRSLIKGITWRVLGTLDTFLLSYLVTESTEAASAIASFELLTKFVLYYVHERAWQKIPRGNVRQIAQRLPPSVKKIIKSIIK